MNSVRYNGVWYKVMTNPHEPDRQTAEISWRLIREPLILPPEAYRNWYANEQRKVKVLYPSFRKDGA